MAQKKVFDKNIIIIVGFVIALALIVVLFKFFTTKKCPEVKFQMLDKEPTTGVPVPFADQTEGASKWDWDFGDSTSHANTANPTHTYSDPKEYIVTLRVNDCGEQTIHVKIASPYIPPMDTNLPQGIINGPQTVYVNQPVTYTDDSKDANKWEWSFGESGATDSRDKKATYIFRKPGLHEVTLTINDGKCKRESKKVNVVPVMPVGKKAPAVSEDEFVKLMNDMHNPGSSYMSFDELLAGNTSLRIKVNGIEKVFSSYCNGLNIQTKEKVTKAKLTKNAQGFIIGIELESVKTSN